MGAGIQRIGQRLLEESRSHGRSAGVRCFGHRWVLCVLLLPALRFREDNDQKQKPDPVTGELQFKSSIDCAMKTMAEGGPLRFYAGFPTFYVRIAPHAMITLIAQDAIKKFWG